VDACIGPLPLPVFPNLAVGVPGIYAFAWKLDLAKNPIWAGVPPPPGGLPDIRPYDDFFNAPAGDYLLVYITQDASGNTYPALDANGIPPIFDAMWAPIFLDGFGNLLPGIDFARLIRVNGCAKLIPSAFDIAFELQEYFAIYDTDSDGTLNATELLVAYVGLHNTYPDLDQDEFNAVVAQLSNGTGTLTEEQVNTFVDAHDGTCTPDTTPPAVLFQDITVELNADGQASLFTETALYGTAAITYLYDNCLGDGKDHLDAFTTTATPDTFTCDDIGKVQVTLTVSDGANKTTGTVTVTVEEGAATCSGCRGCMPGCNKGLSVEGYRKKLADWLLIGLTLTCMFAFSTTRRK
ncbi:MAG: EF-hand domain-containing protein, partial [Candidatus Hydrogenedentes bacterium]|nr:EF-hand domain-containing protein [Candidatus Hydrogenedentota bacterium]